MANHSVSILANAFLKCHTYPFKLAPSVKGLNVRCERSSGNKETVTCKANEAMSKVVCYYCLSAASPLYFYHSLLSDSPFSVSFLLLYLCSLYLQLFLRKKPRRPGMPRQFYASIQTFQHHQPREAICGQSTFMEFLGTEMQTQFAHSFKTIFTE